MNFQEVFMRRRIIVLVTFALGSVVLRADEQKSKIENSPAYDKMKTLVGSWEGKVNEGGAAVKTNARFQLVSDGSALAAWLGEGSPHEMVTMFHMDGNQLMATHYCAAHNQPRMALVNSGDQNRLVFTFKDGTKHPAGRRSHATGRVRHRRSESSYRRVDIFAEREGRHHALRFSAKAVAGFSL
jgi:hypothetical protein